MTVVLLYHDVASRESREATGFKGPLAARYKLEPEQFEAHLDALAATGRTVGIFARGVKPPQLSLTFDDGGASALAAAAAVESRGWRAQFFIATGFVGTDGFLDRDALVDLARRGHAIGGHSHTHPTYMARLTRPELEREWARSRDVLGELLGAAPTVASVPGGMFSRDVAEAAASAGYEVLMTSEPVTRIREAYGIVTVGRYSIRSTTTPERAAAYARGARPARARLWAEWRAKAAAKRISPAAYQRLRRLGV